MKRVLVAVGLVVLCGLVVAVRSVGFERVFDRDSGAVHLAMDDAQYHARRAAFSAEHFPGVLWFDPYLNHPRGAFVPWPPLYDLGLGAGGRLTGDLDAVLAWAPVALGLVTALAVFAVARAQGGAAVALAAVAIFALLPASTRYTSVGNPDHHAVVALLATVLLGGHLAALRSTGRAAWAWQAGLVAARVAVLLTWHGSILYVVLAEAVAVLAATAFGRRQALRAQAVGCSVSAGLGFAALALPHSSFGGTWSAVELSRLQPAGYLGMAALASFSQAWVALARGTLARLGGVALAGVVVAALLSWLAWDSLALGFAYASQAEAFIAFNYEAQPLWRGGLAGVTDLYGFFGLLLPVAPAAGLVGARFGRDAAPGLYFAAWTAALLALAVSNARYGSDFAPTAAVAFALLGGAAVARLGAPGSATRVGAGLVACALIPIASLQALELLAPYAGRSLATLRGARVIVKRPAQGFSRSVHSFVDELRAVTPETAGWDDPAQRPEYGIVTPPTLGFIVNARGRRATPAGNFGPYVGREGIEATNRFYLARDETSALAAIRDLEVRYVITSDEGAAPSRIWHRLHHGDGSATAQQPALGRFRLVSESAAPGVPLGALRGAAPDYVLVPYKLFEIVEGARLEVTGAPGDVIAAQVEVETPSQRRFVYRTQGRVGASGVGELRVPYATAGGHPDAAAVARAVGLARVSRGADLWQVEIPERAVRGGEIVRVGPAAEGPPKSGQPLARTGNSGTFPAP